MLTLAWRNIWRNPRRTALTLLAIAFASGILVFFIGLQQSAFDTSIKANISIFHGFLQVQKDGYLKNPEIRKTIMGASELRDRIVTLPGVKAVAQRAIGFGLLSSAERTYGAQVVGVEVDREGSVSTIPSLIREGNYLSAESALEAVIGKDLARNLKIKVGEEITLLGQGKDGSVAATVLKLVGIFESGAREMDRNMIEIPLGTFSDVFSLSDEAHTLVIVGDDLRKLAELSEKVRTVLQGENASEKLVVHSWDELLPGLLQAIQLDTAGHVIFRSALIIIVMFSVLNTFLMSVMERTREFGVMLALGETPFQLALLIILECLLLTLLGVVLGTTFGSATILYYGKYGFYVPGSEEVMKVWSLPVAIYTQLTLRSLTSGPLVILLTSLLSVLYPAFRLMRVEPVEALRAT